MDGWEMGRRAKKAWRGQESITDELFKQFEYKKKNKVSKPEHGMCM